MRHPIVALAIAAVTIAGAGSALARAPANLPTLEDVLAHARQVEAKEAASKGPSSKDRTQETIDDYRTKKAALDDWGKLTQIMKDSATEELQKYRAPAAKAILDRFTQEDLKDPRVRQVRIAIGLDICELLQAPAKDATGLTIAQDIIGAWWPRELSQSKWLIGGKQRDRKTACDKIRKFLKNSEKD